MPTFFWKKINMKKIEELFKKVNKDKIELKESKDNLRRYLLKNEYFSKQEKNSFDLKLAFSSVAFSIFLVAIAFFCFPSNQINTKEASLKEAPKVSKSLESVKEMQAGNFKKEREPLFNQLIKKNNVKIIGQETWQNKEVFTLELIEDDFKTRYYFNKEKNLLLSSEILPIINNNK